MNGVEDRTGATLAEASVLVWPSDDVGLAHDGDRHGGTGQVGQVIQLPKHVGDASDLLKLFRRGEVTASLLKEDRGSG